MSVPSDGDVGGESSGVFHRLQALPIELIDPNKANPRLIFPQEELDRLAESIATEGILVPIVVYEDGDRYTLIDGERRFKCAMTLGLAEVPALITAQQSERDSLIQMFNIHLVREPWRDMPTAWALERLVEKLDESGEPTTDKAISEITGMSTERIRRLRHALELPAEYQKYIHEGTIPLNWFWELHRNVIQPLSKQRPTIYNHFGKDAIVGSFVEKRLSGVITDTVSLRDVRPIINYAARDAAASDTDETVLDATLEGLIDDPNLSIAVAFEDTVQIMVEVDKLQRSTDNMVTSFERLFARVGEGERATVIGIGERLVAALTDVLDANRE